MHLARRVWPFVIVAFAGCSSVDDDRGKTPEGQDQVAGDDSPGATETNVARVHCTEDAECPPAMRCVPFQEGDPLGACVGDAGPPDGE